MDFSKIDKTGLLEPNLLSVLGMKYIPTEEDDVCMATMPVNEITRQPFGYLCGGATIALAESLAGAGSVMLAPGCICSGVNVSATHCNAVAEGGTVTARAKIIKQGKNIHIWEVTVTDDIDRIVSVVTVTNYVRPYKEKQQ